MNVLEKILEEIDEATFQADAPIYLGDVEVDRYVQESVVKEIIRFHMDDAKDTNVTSKCSECSRRKWYQKGYEDGKKDICNDNGWIPVEERLPEVPEGLADEYCPEFNVTIKGAERTTTLKYSWDGTWFDDNGNVYNVIAWQPLPAPYKPKKATAAGMEHIMRRFTKVE